MISIARFRQPVLFFILALLPSLAIVAPAQASPAVASTSAAPQEAPVEAAAPAADPYGRGTPRGALEGYIKAVSREDYQRATEYLDLEALPVSKRIQSQRVAKILQQTLDQSGNVPPPVMLSGDPQGQLDDGLEPDLEKVGTLTLGQEKVPLLLKRIGNDEKAFWVISAQTLNKLPQGIRDESSLAINQLIPSTLIEIKWNGVPVGHWIALVILGLVAYSASHMSLSLLASSTCSLLRRRVRSYPEGLVRAFTAPLAVFLATWLFALGAQWMGISIVARHTLAQVVTIATWFSVVWLIWRLIAITATLAEHRMASSSRFGALSAVRLLRRGSLIFTVVVGVLVGLYMAGVDVTTGLAAIGIGGIAVALAAQKAMENLVGSATLVLDQPVRIGDFCKVGDTLGTIEQIGMRSTRIRTLDRTLVTIPNADFSGQKIENYSHRDRFLYRPVLRLRYQTRPEQIRYLLSAVQEIISNHPQIDPDPARVCFLGFGDNSLDIDIFAYIHAEDYNEFLQIQQLLNLDIADALARCGAEFASAGRTVYLATEPGHDMDTDQLAAGKVKELRVEESGAPRAGERRLVAHPDIPRNSKWADALQGNRKPMR